jgi:CheY-like chemotaxis protein
MKKILIIEDHVDMRHLLERQVELMGFVALSATSAKDGVRIAIAEKPDLILLDIMMPTSDGLEATRTLRANVETSETPILVASALSRNSDIEACMEAGCTDFIAKPFTFYELQIKIRQLIGSS